MTTPFDGATILIVDDTPSNLKVVVDLFEGRGYRVAIAQDGEEGLQRACLVRPDLILLDVMLPGADGFEICRRLKADERTRDIPVIFMTSLASTEHKVKGFEAGGIDYVTKPLQLDEVLARAATHLNLRAARRDLEARNAQLDAYRLELERRVDERTAELSASNRQLREENDLRRAAEERLQLKNFALDHVHESAFLVDETGRIHYVNKEACRRLGYSAEEMLGLGLGDIDPDWPVDLRPEVWAAHCSALKGLGGQTFETRHRTRDGEIFPVEVSANYFEHGGQAYVLGLARDIGERKRAERELHLLNLALDQSFDATYLVDTDLRFRYVNQAAERALGYSRDELLAMNLLDIDPNVSREAVHGLMNQTTASGRFPGTVESRHRRKDGTTFPIEVGATTFAYGGETLFLTVVRDITERKRAEEELVRHREHLEDLIQERTSALREALEFTQGVINAIPDLLFELDRDGRYLNIWTHTPELLAAQREALLGHGVEEALSPESAATVLDALREAEAGGLSFGRVIRIDLPAGTAWFELSVSRRPGGAPGDPRFLVLSRDIGERVRSEERIRRMNSELEQRVRERTAQLEAANHALRAGELEYRTLANNLPDYIARYDLVGRKRYVNPALAKVLGESGRNMLGRTAREIYPDGGFEDYAREVDRTLATGEDNELEKTFPGPDGLVTHQIRFLAERDEAGEIVGALIIGRDISERKRAEAALASREREYRTLAENLPDNVIRYNLAGQAVYYNPRYGRSLPEMADGILGKTPAESFPDNEDVRLYQSALERVLATGEPERIEVRVPGGDGEIETHQVSFVAERRPSGEIRGALAIGRDVTALVVAERRLAESHARLRELLARREADRDEERRRIAREMHDELGQVLTALKLGIATLRIQFGRDLPTLAARVDGLLDLADKSIQSVRALATRLRPAALEMGLFPALRWLAEEFERHGGVPCRVNLPEGAGRMDDSRATVIFRAVQEALTNAARYAGASQVDIVLECASDGACLLEIRDDGRGFDPAAVGKRGFGLLGMRERIDSVGGELSLDSAPGAGARVRIRIPAPAATDNATEDAE